MVGRKISFKHTEKCETYLKNGQYFNTEVVIIEDGTVIDKYRGSFQKLNDTRDIFNYAFVDFYLVSKKGVLYHVLPTDVIIVN